MNGGNVHIYAFAVQWMVRSAKASGRASFFAAGSGLIAVQRLSEARAIRR
jgi:hypothetical protein